MSAAHVRIVSEHEACSAVRLRTSNVTAMSTNVFANCGLSGQMREFGCLSRGAFPQFPKLWVGGSSPLGDANYFKILGESHQLGFPA
jgi:hypothetical protein